MPRGRQPQSEQALTIAGPRTNAPEPSAGVMPSPNCSPYKPNTPTTEALQAIVELDLEALADIVPPRGYGRD